MSDSERLVIVASALRCVTKSVAQLEPPQGRKMPMEAWFSKVRSGLVPVKFIAILPLILLAVCISLQAQLPTATLLGVVKDTSGASVAGATVTIRNTDIGSIRTVTTE